MLGGNGLVGLRCNAPSSLTLHGHGKQSVEVGAFHTDDYAKFAPSYGVAPRGSSRRACLSGTGRPCASVSPLSRFAVHTLGDGGSTAQTLAASGIRRYSLIATQIN